MKIKILLPVFAAILTFAAALARAGDVKLIANSSVRADTVSPEEIRRIFLEQNSFLADGSHVEPVIEEDGPVHESFLQTYLDRTNSDLQTYYQALVFTGRGSMPKQLSSDSEVVAYVAKTRGAIGYVSSDALAPGVKTLFVARTEEKLQRRLITRVEPEYPEVLKRLSIGGSVRLQVTISAKGNVEGVHLLGGNPILGESAAYAVKRWIYASGHSRTTVEVVIPFDPSL